MNASRFLTAEWRWLVMLNYEVEPSVLARFVPAGTELDSWEGKTFVSMVGFQFLKTRVGGWTIPFHADFEEVNLRFYVRRQTNEGWRRAVVFIKELVPRRAIAWTARTLYNENYIALPMSHSVEVEGRSPKVSYRWMFRGRSHGLGIETTGEAMAVREGSEEEFITEHYWGYARQRDGGTVEYQVEHPRWQVWTARKATFDCEVAGLYGAEFAPFLSREPSSAFLADGSEVAVYRGTRVVL